VFHLRNSSERRQLLPIRKAEGLGAISGVPEDSTLSACAHKTCLRGGNVADVWNTLRRGGRMHHLKVGTAHARRRVLAMVDEHEVTIVALDAGELLSVHRIEPDKGYWRNRRRDPGRWPGSRRPGGSPSSPMTRPMCHRCRDS
jgi:hypothetical protein